MVVFAFAAAAAVAADTWLAAGFAVEEALGARISSEVLAVDDECQASSSSACSASALQRRSRLLGDAPRPAEVERRFFVWLSDIHMDTTYGVPRSFGSDAAACVFGCHGKDDCPTMVSTHNTSDHPFGMYGCDPPDTLWKSAVEAAHEASGGAELVLFTGDFTRHGTEHMPHPWSDVINTIGSAKEIFVEAFKALTDERKVLMGTLGNNDVPSDYEVNITDTPTNAWYAAVDDKLKTILPISSGEGSRDYSYGGYFASDFGRVRIINLQTLIYSQWHTPAEPVPDDPFGQLAWLRSELEAAVKQSRPVWIAGHIPPGTETFSYTSLWRPKYVQAYLDIVQDPRLGRTIAGQFFGHCHAEEVRILPKAPADAGPVLIMGAASPIFHNNPSFRLVEYDRHSGRILNVKVYFAELPPKGDQPKWQFGYDFAGAYPALQASILREGGMTNAGVINFVSDLHRSWQESGALFDIYAVWYKTRMNSDMRCAADPSRNGPDVVSADTKRRYIGKYLCGVNITTSEAFDSCAVAFSLPVEKLAPAALEKGSELAYWRDAHKQHWSTIATAQDLELVKKQCGHMIENA